MLSARVRMVLFYVVMVVALVTVATRSQQQFLPGGLATQIGHNSEALLFAILVCGGIQVRRALPEERRVLVVAVAAVVLVVLGVLLLQTDWTSSVRTLNEPLIGSGFVLAYTLLPRSPLTGVVATLVVLALVVVFFDTAVVLDQAESLVPLVLAGISLDVVDRTILQPWRPDAMGLRIIWMAVLLAAVVVFMLAARAVRPDLVGPVDLGIDYGQRAAEAYWGWLLVHAYFGLWLGRSWRESPAGQQPALAQVR